MKASYLAVGLALASVAAGPVTPEADLPIRPDAARTFPAEVQPVLMNLCARCHCRPDHPGGFKLARVADGYSDAYATARNLWATAAFVRADQPSASPLLAKAVSPHGGMKDPPIYGRGHPAFRHLEWWAARALISGTPPAKPSIVQAGAAVPATSTATAVPSSLPPVEPQPTIEAHPEPAKPNPNDPFDPAVFNRTARGGK